MRSRLGCVRGPDGCWWQVVPPALSGALGSPGLSQKPQLCVEGDFGTCDLDVTAQEAGNGGTASRISSLTSPGPPETT